MQFFRRHPYIDRSFWFLYLLLIGVSVIALFSAGSSMVYERADTSTLGPVGRHIAFLLVGCFLAYGLQFLPSKVATWAGYIALVVSLLCLYIMLIPHNPIVVVHNGAARWCKLFGVEFQPSEIAKLGLIIVVADILTRAKSDEEKRKAFFITLALTAVTCTPILPHNLSTTLLLFGIVLLLWILARVEWKYVLSVVGIAVATLVLGYCIVEFGYVRPQRKLTGPFSRSITWVNRVDAAIEEMKRPKGEVEVNDANYQRNLAKVAVMRGGKTPIGVLPGNSQERDYLPYAHEEYIYSIIVEETGIVGGTLLIFIYLAILFRACYASTKFRDDQRAMLTVMGLALMLTCQALVSMMVAVGLGPVTGQPLPLVSHGGTSVLTTSLYFAIMMCVSREQEAMRDRQNKTTITSEGDVPTIPITPLSTSITPTV